MVISSDNDGDGSGYDGVQTIDSAKFCFFSNFLNKLIYKMEGKKF